jgi:G3E family GTPase
MAVSPLQPKPPVTILCGFLGAGKTTLLQHLLTQASGRRWALVVNDMAALNIDAALVRAKAGEPEGTERDLVELGGGCVCCSSRDELAETISELAASGRYEHILVETTGAAEPRSVAALFTQKNLFGRSLTDFATLSALITVIDAAHFLREWQIDQNRTARAIVTGTIRPLFELMIEQAECADLIVINKRDLVSEEELAKLETILRGLNPRAELISATRGEFSADQLLGHVRFEAPATLSSATWLRTLNALDASRTSAQTARETSSSPSHQSTGQFVLAAGQKPSRTLHRSAHEEKYGLSSIVYQARQPFARDKFQALLASGLPGVVRAKGFFWIQEQPDEMGFLSIAGGSLRLDFLNYWGAALVENRKVSRSDLPAKIQILWQEPHGDRRQELVFIGVGLDAAALHEALDRCVVK